MYYDVDKDIVYYACLTHTELFIFSILVICIWQLRYFVYALYHIHKKEIKQWVRKVKKLLIFKSK